ncbi:hypothetical protein [Amaricoccus solimangrovi]|uniref:Uncharacterized protein n=1 Tax=Amaricoccus solimangrovi TaxID=2589815 RepID=A0A501WXZ9_9RHOB|nr:hypothetical protein [Amaricoccus solimangrovi]TPE53074.1 hypothetical protein FJM51_03355 [Amaricoccus solimangrovi]
MATSVKSIIDQSLRKLGIVGIGEQASADEHAEALSALRMMLDTWSLEALLVPFTVTERFDLTAGQAFYSMGTGGDWDTSRPTRVEQIRMLSDDDRTRFIPQLSANALRDQPTVEEGCPTAWVGSQDSLFYLVELNAYPLEPAVLVTSRKPFDAAALDNFDRAYSETAAPEKLSPSGFTMTGIQTSIDFPPGYLAAIVYNLAVHLAPEYAGLVLDPIIAAQAERAKALIKINNTQPRDLVLDPVLTGRRRGYDIRTGP